MLTAAHCLQTNFTGFFGEEIPYKPNSYYPTFESTISVYAGVQDISFIKNSSTPPSPGIKIAVAKVIKVSAF